MSMGRRIAQARHALGLSQETLAKSCGVSRVAVTLWEGDASAPKLDKIAKVASYLNVTPEWLAFGVNRGSTETGFVAGALHTADTMPNRELLTLCIETVLDGVGRLDMPMHSDELSEISVTLYETYATEGLDTARKNLPLTLKALLASRTRKAS